MGMRHFNKHWRLLDHPRLRTLEHNFILFVGCLENSTIILIYSGVHNIVENLIFTMYIKSTKISKLFAKKRFVLWWKNCHQRDKAWKCLNIWLICPHWIKSLFFCSAKQHPNCNKKHRAFSYFDLLLNCAYFPVIAFCPRNSYKKTWVLFI